MEWILAKNQMPAMQEYHLMDDGFCKSILKYNTHQNVARVSCKGRYGVFFIERSGSLLGKIVFKNEYGQEVGKLSFDKWYSNGGSIILEGEKYHFSFQNDSPVEIIIYKNDIRNPLIKCELMVSADHSSQAFNGNADEEYACLLLGLCWYSFFPVVPENVADYSFLIQ